MFDFFDDIQSNYFKVCPGQQTDNSDFKNSIKRVSKQTCSFENIYEKLPYPNSKVS